MAATAFLVSVVRDEVYYGSGSAATDGVCRMAANVRVELHAQVVVLAAQTHVLLLEVANADLCGREGSDLLWGEVEGGLELCDRLLQLCQ